MRPWKRNIDYNSDESWNWKQRHRRRCIRNASEWPKRPWKSVRKPCRSASTTWQCASTTWTACGHTTVSCTTQCWRTRILNPPCIASFRVFSNETIPFSHSWFSSVWNQVPLDPPVLFSIVHRPFTEGHMQLSARMLVNPIPPRMSAVKNVSLG